ncbi:hypothetical protein vBBceHLY2_00105 [Bacillus phage vB_BceH_LY2]|nr:hypothetical protein vBBceHLY2_00105 [Bacillus phage vB_BceH_LY2]
MKTEKNKQHKVWYIPMIAVLIVLGYRLFFTDGYSSNGSNPQKKQPSVANWYTGDKSYAVKIKEFESFMNFTTNDTEEFKDWNMVWTAYDERTPVVMIDFENLAKVNNAAVSDAEQVVRNNVKLFGKYLQMFNNKVHGGKMKQGDLTLVVLNHKGEEVTMTQVMTPVSLTN